MKFNSSSVEVTEIPEVPLVCETIRTRIDVQNVSGSGSGVCVIQCEKGVDI